MDIKSIIIPYYAIQIRLTLSFYLSKHGKGEKCLFPGFWIWLVLAYFGGSGPRSFGPILGVLDLDFDHFGTI